MKIDLWAQRFFRDKRFAPPYSSKILLGLTPTYFSFCVWKLGVILWDNLYTKNGTFHTNSIFPVKKEMNTPNDEKFHVRHTNWQLLRNWALCHRSVQKKKKNFGIRDRWTYADREAASRPDQTGRKLDKEHSTEPTASIGKVLEPWSIWTGSGWGMKAPKMICFWMFAVGEIAIL